MISSNMVRTIAEIIVGDIEGFYPYIKGPEIFNLFNFYFGFKDTYEFGNAPTRWRHAADRISMLIEAGRGDAFFSVMLSHRYMMQRHNCSEVEAREHADKALDEFRRLLALEGYSITGSDGNFHLVKQDSDLVLLGEGGFAKAYLQKSTGLVLKKLNPDLMSDFRFRSRFKREFEIMKSLEGIDGVLAVYEYEHGSCSYTMEMGEKTLEEFAKEALSDSIRTVILQQVISTMSAVHEKGVIHRDISPSNIFIVHGSVKIADFGLGKNLEIINSYQTRDTRNYGQYFYCSPEQMLYLKDGDKRSDVYSLGRLINFVMTGHPLENAHCYRGVVEKATSHDPQNRYQNAGELLIALLRRDELVKDSEYEKKMLVKLRSKIIDEDVTGWLLSKSPSSFCSLIVEHRWLNETLVTFSAQSESNAAFVIDSLVGGMATACGNSFEANDPFADIAYGIIIGKAPFDVKERACGILSHVAWYVNRWHAQGLIDSACAIGIDPMLEDLLRG